MYEVGSNTYSKKERIAFGAEELSGEGSQTFVSYIWEVHENFFLTGSGGYEKFHTAYENAPPNASDSARS